MRHARLLRGASLAVPVLLIAVGVTAPAQARALSRDVTDKVIIVLRDQFPGLPDTARDSARRTDSVASAQRAILRELTATHARDVRPITLINSIAATVSPAEASRLAGNPAVAEVVKDQPIPIASAPTLKLGQASKGGLLPGVCPVKKTGVQLNPEAVEAIHAATQSGKNSAQALGYTGAGVKVAFVADGLDPNNPDFIRANGQHVFVDYRDFSGTGTDASTGGGEAFLDASSIAAQGRHVYNLAKFAGLPRPCLIRILGSAPGASLVGLNVAGSSFVTFLSVFTEAIDYAATVDHVNVINESFGENPFPDAGSLDLVELADNAAVKAGIAVIVSSGDAGVTNTIASPASDPKVISVGATTTYRSYAQTGFEVIGTPGTSKIKGWIDNNISGLSSAGFDQAGRTVDVVAPGDLNWALCSSRNQFEECGGAAIQLEGGTSESAPLTAGVAALVIQAYRAGHHGRTPSPAVIRRIIVSTAQDIGSPADQQGAGLVDAYQAVLAARSYPGTTQARAGHSVLASATQLNAVAPRSTTERFTDTLTNDGAGSATVHLTSRTLSPYHTVAARTLRLTPMRNDSTSVRFRVAPGQARLNASVTLEGGLSISLIAPNGDLAAFNLPQGESGYGNAQVADPAPGIWTALISGSPANFNSAVSAPFLAQTATWKPFGTLSARSVTLAPGASRAISLTVSTPAQPGDEAGSIVLRGPASQPGFAAVTTIPVTLRSLAPVPSTFTGTLTGGNGRGPRMGQTAYYEIDVSSALPALNATVDTASRRNPVFVELVSPAGIAESAAGNDLLETDANGDPRLEPQLGAQVHVVNPARGIWTLIVDFYGSVSGTAARQPFDVSIDDAAAASETGLPDTATTRLPAGQSVTAQVTITNHSAVPTEYFIDPRLHAQVTVKLPTQTVTGVVLPDLTDEVPTYLVPSHTSSLSATVTAAKPNLFEFAWPFGDPGVLSSTGKTSRVTITAPDIPDGDWTIQPFLKGPDGAKQVKPVLARASVTAVIAPIDPAITDPTGDLWAEVTDQNAAFSPYVVQPGQTITIPVIITPHGAPGTIVSGTIYASTMSFNPQALDNFFLDGAYPTTSDVAAFDYKYTIKGN